MKSTTRLLSVLVVALILAPAVAHAQKMVILVRHAERADGGTPPPGMKGPADPLLSAAGEARAQKLAAMLAESGVTAIYTTEFHRTQDTAKPLAAKLGVTAQTLPADDLSRTRREDQGRQAHGRRLHRRPLEHRARRHQAARRSGGEDRRQRVRQPLHRRAGDGRDDAHQVLKMAQLERAIGPLPATLLVIGSVIGSGIFLTTGDMAKALPSPTLLLLAWAAGSLFALTGALTYAELGTMFPRAGGVYVFLNEAFGPLLGFLYGWTTLLVVLAGGIAAVAVGFAHSFNYFVPGAPVPLVAVASIVAPRRHQLLRRSRRRRHQLGADDCEDHRTAAPARLRARVVVGTRRRRGRRWCRRRSRRRSPRSGSRSSRCCGRARATTSSPMPAARFAIRRGRFRAR